MRALLDCPVHAIIAVGTSRPSDDGTAHPDARPEATEPEPRNDSDAVAEFVR
jgi:hypothetical protein